MPLRTSEDSKQACNRSIPDVDCQKSPCIYFSLQMIKLLAEYLKITIFLNHASRWSHTHHFAKRLQAFSIKNFTFLTPKRPQKEHVLSFCLLLLLL